MERALGLSRDPFAPVADGGLYWEGEGRDALRGELTAALREGRSVALHGEDGSGRRTLATRVAAALAAEGLPVALLEEPERPTGEAFLVALAAQVGAAPPEGADLLTLAEHVYRRLVEVFCATRAAVLVLPWAPAPTVAEEIGILAELRLLGRPLAAVAVLSDPSPPAAPFAPVAVPTPSRDDLREFLAHRCAAAGRVDLLPPAVLEACLAGPPSFRAALARARTALWAREFDRAVATPAAPATVPAASVLDPAQVEEVGRLLDTFSAEFP